MLSIRYVQIEDKEFWYSLDRHLPEQEFVNKVSSKTGYILLDNGIPVGLMRYNLFWDTIPFCNLLYIKDAHQRKLCGTKLMEYWEADMKAKGYDRVITSTQANEEAQHFYRKLGYHECGGFILEIGEPMELIMTKKL